MIFKARNESYISVTCFFLFILPSAASHFAFSFHASPELPAAYQFSSYFFFYYYLFVCLPLPLQQGQCGSNLLFEPHCPACCGRWKVWSHGIAISPAKQHGSRQLQAAAGPLIRASVMTLYLAYRWCHTPLKGGRL